jgi:hypothetical protein
MAVRRLLDSSGNPMTGWLEDAGEGDEPVELVVAPSGLVGARASTHEQASGIDQIGGPRPPQPLTKDRSKHDDPFDVSGLDQS